MENVKEAQRRYMSWLTEKLNVPRHMSEALSGNYREQMMLLRQVDNQMRETAKTLKVDLKEAKRAAKLGYLIHFDQKIQNITQTISEMQAQVQPLINSRTELIDDFYGQQYEPVFAKKENEIIKESGIMDSIKREFGQKYLEKMYPSVRQRNVAVRGLSNKLNMLVNSVLGVLKRLGSLRSSGNVGGYIQAASKIEKYIKDFKIEYSAVRKEYLEPIIERQRKEEPKETPDEEIEVEYEEPERKQLKGPEIEPPPEAAKGPIITPPPEVSPAPEGTQAYEGVFDPQQVGGTYDLTVEQEPPSTPDIEQAIQQEAPQSYQMPEWAQQQVPQERYVELQIDEQGKVVPGTVRIKHMGEWAKAKAKIDTLIKTAIKQGKSDLFIGEMFLKLAESEQKQGNPEESLQMLAIAEGFLEDIQKSVDESL